MLWEFRYNKNTTETAKKIYSVYGQGDITNCQVWNWFSKYCFGNTSLRDESRPGYASLLNQEALRELVECSLH